MLISDRRRQLEKAIPAAISELGAASIHDRNGYMRDSDKQEALRAARELLVLAKALEAASQAALDVLLPKPPDNHYHTHVAAPTPQLRPRDAVGVKVEPVS